MPAPKTRRVAGVLATLGCVVLSGCQQAPTAPARAQAQTTHIGGQVTDALLRGLSEALVEVLDGPDAGERFVADADGRFAATSTGSRLQLCHPPSQQRRVPVDYGGNPPGYRLTPRQHMCSCECQALNPTTPLGGRGHNHNRIDLESARSRYPGVPCPGYPVELSSRTYNARITEGPAGRRDVYATGPTVAREANFLMFVAGERAGTRFVGRCDPRRSPRVPSSHRRGQRPAERSSPADVRGLDFNPDHRRVPLLRIEIRARCLARLLAVAGRPNPGPPLMHIRSGVDDFHEAVVNSGR